RIVVAAAAWRAACLVRPPAAASVVLWHKHDFEHQYRNTPRARDLPVPVRAGRDSPRAFLVALRASFAGRPARPPDGRVCEYLSALSGILQHFVGRSRKWSALPRGL